MNNTTSEPISPSARSSRPRLRKGLALGCLVPAFGFCAVLGLVIAVVVGGPVIISLPANATLSLGHDDFVLSNYSFQNGTTYFIDLKGTDIRSILELHVLPDTHKIEVVLNHATKQEQKENHLLDLTTP